MLTDPSSSPVPAVPPAGVGRPRDPRIDGAVLQATTELLEEVGYLQLTVGAIAERAGTNKPAIYRRWPTKAHLVHEAVFPAQDPAAFLPGDDLRSDIRSLVAVGVELLGRPAARAALPGLIAEMASDTTLHTDVIERFAGRSWGWLQHRIDEGILAGEVRSDVRSSTVLELIAGSTFVATSVRPLDELGPLWVDDVTDVIVRGITP
jgi:AcrR family transcriptional regulator